MSITAYAGVHVGTVLPSLVFFLQNWATLTLLPQVVFHVRVEATPKTWYLAPEMWILPGEPHQKHIFYPPERDFYWGTPLKMRLD